MPVRVAGTVMFRPTRARGSGPGSWGHDGRIGRRGGCGELRKRWAGGFRKPSATSSPGAAGPAGKRGDTAWAARRSAGPKKAERRPYHTSCRCTPAQTGAAFARGPAVAPCAGEEPPRRRRSSARGRRRVRLGLPAAGARRGRGAARAEVPAATAGPGRAGGASPAEHRQRAAHQVNGQRCGPEPGRPAAQGARGAGPLGTVSPGQILKSSRQTTRRRTHAQGRNSDGKEKCH